MSPRFAFLAIVLAVPAFSQPVQKNWIAPRTAGGQPDLQGTWTNATMTPLARPRDLAGKEFFTPEEAAAYEKRVLDRRGQEPATPRNVDNPSVWWEQGAKVVKTLRTSLIVDPPDGKIPPLTPEAQKRMAEARAETRRHPADRAEDRSLQERCLLSPTAGPPMLPGPYNNDYQIVQTPGYVMIAIEMIHDVRMIPLDGRPHLAPGVRQWLGDSRGRWEGDTLVVETTNFTNKTNFHGSDENLHLIERFTRTAPDTLLYRFTVDDPTAFSKPWTAEIPMSRTSARIYEFACHEGNRALEHILINARAEEQTGSKILK